MGVWKNSSILWLVIEQFCVFKMGIWDCEALPGVIRFLFLFLNLKLLLFQGIEKAIQNIMGLIWAFLEIDWFEFNFWKSFTFCWRVCTEVPYLSLEGSFQKVSPELKGLNPERSLLTFLSNPQAMDWELGVVAGSTFPFSVGYRKVSCRK